MCSEADTVTFVVGGRSPLLVAVTLALSACGGKASQVLMDDPQAPSATDTSDGAAMPPAEVCPEVVSTDSGAFAPPLPLGVYTQCHSNFGNAGLSADGYGGTISLEASGSILTLEMGSDVFPLEAGTLGFTPITASNAIIMPGQTYRLSLGPCATSTIDSGALALDGDTVILSLVGEGCQQPIMGTSRCTVPAIVAETLASPNACSAMSQPHCDCKETSPTFAFGTYSQCGSIYGLTDPAGKVTITQNQGVVNAAFDRIWFSAAPAIANLKFIPTTDTTATIAPDQTWLVTVLGAYSPFVSVTMTITSGSLVLDGSTLFVFVSGKGSTGLDIHEAFHCAADK